MYPRWTETTKRIVAVGGAIMALLLLYLARSTLLYLLVAGVIAYALYPIVDWLDYRLRFPRVVATLSVYLLLLLLLAAIPILVVPLVAGQVRALNLNLATLLSDGREWLRQALESWRSVQLLGTSLDLSSLVDPALNSLGEAGSLPPLPPPESWLPRLFGTLGGFASTLTSAMLAFVLTLLYSFYLVKDSPEWGRQLDQLVPESYQPEWNELQRQLNGIWGSFFRGQLLFSLVMAAVTFVVLLAMGISGSIPLALLVGLLEVIPNIGPLIALFPIAIVAFIQGSSTLPLAHGWVLLIVVAAYIVIQVLGTNILAPIIIGGSVNLSPLVMLVGVVIGASVAGLIGAFLATPLVASLRVLAAYGYNKILDRPPFPGWPGEDRGIQRKDETRGKGQNPTDQAANESPG